MKVLALAAYPEAGASSRFRVLQYAPLLAARGVELEFSSFLSTHDFAHFYDPQHRAAKARAALSGIVRQTRRILERNDYDVLWVQREAMMLGPAWSELFATRALRKPMVFDFDDAIWLPNAGPQRHPVLAKLLRYPSKTSALITHAAHVFAATEYLADFARAKSTRVSVIPTVVSRETWRPLPSIRKELVVGWVGTHSTAPFLELVRPALLALWEKGLRFRIRIVGAGTPLSFGAIPVDNTAWTLAAELDNFHAIDIGLAPMPDTPWNQGKGGFKQLQYMACGIPCVTSMWRGGTDFIRDEANALVAHDTSGWVRALERVLTDSALRAKLAECGRALVEEEYCAEQQSQRIAVTFNGL